MAHGFTFKELAKRDAICSEKVKKALNINSTYDDDLKKGLSWLQKERKCFLNSLTKKKLDIIQKKCNKLPAIHREPSEAEYAMMQRKVAGFCNGVSNNGSAQLGGSSTLQSRPQSQPSSDEVMAEFYRRQKDIDSDKRFSATLDEGDLMVHRAAWLSSPNGDVAFGKAGSQILPSPGVCLPPPRSPVLSRMQSSSTLDPNEGSRSMPCSPRFQRRRANTLDTPRNLAPSHSWNNLKKALELSLSMPATMRGARPRAESSPVDFEGLHEGKISPREGRLSPQVRRLRAIQPSGNDQTLPTQDDPFHLPRLMDAGGSLPFLPKDGGAERGRRRVNSLITDKTAVKDLSPRREALMNHGSVSPSPKSGLAESETENNKSPTHVENDEALLWISDEDDDDDDKEDDDDVFDSDIFAAEKGKKIHTMEEIKHTRYLRMKSPHHWLPKTGPVPKNLLSSSIIVGHTKIINIEKQDRSDEENEDGDEEDDGTEEIKIVDEENSKQEMSNGTNCNSELEKNVADA